MRPATRILWNLLICGYIALGIPLAWMAFLLVVGAETAPGRLFGGTCLFAFQVPVLIWFSRYVKRSRPYGICSVGFGLCAVCSLLGCVAFAPRGQAAEDEAFQSVYRGSHSYRRLSIANLVPEIDQLKLGSYLFPQVDPYIDPEQGERIRSLFLDIYRDLRHSDAFIDVGSALGDVYRDLFLGQREGGHLYTYIPETGSEDPLPILLFLHGSLGNFKGYLLVWKRFAEEQGVAIVAPSFGAGNWYLEGGIEAVDLALGVCEDHPRLDADRVILAGLSNGGTGVSRAASLRPDAFEGLIFLSPVMEPEILGSGAFTLAWSGRPVLVITGETDRRIPVQYVEQAVSILRDQEVKVRSKVFADEDHFLFFSQPDEVLDVVSRWVIEL